MPKCWKKVRTTLKAAKSDSGFLHRLRTTSTSKKNISPESSQHKGRDQQHLDEDDVETQEYAPLTFHQYEDIPSTSTSQPMQPNLTIEYINTEKPDNRKEVIYAKPHKIKYASLPTIEVTHDDSNDSDEIMSLSQISGDNLSLQLSSEEKNQNINSILTLSTLLKDIQKSFISGKISPPSLEDDTVDNKKYLLYELNKVEKYQNFLQTENRFDITKINEDSQEIVNFKNIISRLIELLKKYQPELSIENINENFEDKTGHFWPIDVNYLTPLFVAYDNSLKEKDEIIQHQETKLLEFVHLEQEQNERKIQLNKWKLMCEEANFEIKEFKRKEFEYQEKIQKISQQLIALQGENNSLQSKLDELEIKNMLVEELQSKNYKLKSKLADLESKVRNLTEKYRTVAVQLKKSISEKKHLKIIHKIKGNFSEKNKKLLDEVQELRQELQLSNDELLKFAAEKCQLEGQNTALIKNLRSTERKSILYEEQYDRTIDEFAIARHYFDNVELVIEELSAEKDVYIETIEQQKRKLINLKKQIIKGNAARNKLKSKFKKYKKKTTKKNRIPFPHNPDLNKNEEYEQEIKRLNYLFNQGTEKYRLILDEKRNLERDLELVWRVCSTENQHLLLKK